MSTRIEVEHIDSIADVKLARPDKLNAMDTDMFTSIIDTAKSINDDPSIRVVVLSGQGKGFCAGLDVESIMPELTEAGSLLAESDESSGCTTAAAKSTTPYPQSVPTATHKFNMHNNG